VSSAADHAGASTALGASCTARYARLSGRTCANLPYWCVLAVAIRHASASAYGPVTWPGIWLTTAAPPGCCIADSREPGAAGGSRRAGGGRPRRACVRAASDAAVIPGTCATLPQFLDRHNETTGPFCGLSPAAKLYRHHTRQGVEGLGGDFSTDTLSSRRKASTGVSGSARRRSSRSTTSSALRCAGADPVKAYSVSSQLQVKAQGLWAIFLAGAGRPGLRGKSGWLCSIEVIGQLLRALSMFRGGAPIPGTWNPRGLRHLRIRRSGGLSHCSTRTCSRRTR